MLSKSSARWVFLGLSSAASLACQRENRDEHANPSASAAPLASASATEAPCTAARPVPNVDTTTTYVCSDATAKSRCAAGDVTSCTPSSRTRGAVPPGGKCVHPTARPAEAAKFELGDDCAPQARFAGKSSPKGSSCILESGVGGPYCTHGCASTADCSDVLREGFVAECSAGSCLLSKR